MQSRLPKQHVFVYLCQLFKKTSPLKITYVTYIPLLWHFDNLKITPPYICLNERLVHYFLHFYR